MKQRKMLAKGIKALLALIVLYAVFLGTLYNFQRNLLFFPSHEDPFMADYQPMEAFSYTTSDDLKLRGMWYPPKQDKPVIVLFHGNAGNLGNRLFKAKLFISRGYGVALVSYHGYDGNPGTPSEQHFYDDARSALKTLHDEKHVANNHIVLYGESIGTGVATQMASEMPDIKALILEASYTSIPDVASKTFWFVPTHYLIQDKFESSKKIGALQMPVLIIHGTDDLVIPYHFGQKLFKNVTSSQKQFVTLKGAGHNNLYDYGAEEAIHLFIDQLDGNS